MSLTNKIAIVTGGAMGIGGAIARRLAADGAKVLVADILPDAAAENVARIEEAGGTASAHRVDISQPEQIRPMIERAVELWGGLHFLVNNAWGTEEPDGSAITLTESAFDRALVTSQKAVYLGAKYGVPHIQASGGGSIVNISSVHGQLVSPQSLAYEMTKAAIIAMSRQMAVDFGPLGVRVNCICPGHIVTERGAEHWESNPSLLRFFDQQYPLRHTGVPDDIASAVRFLCSGEARFITGHTLVVDGGLSIQLQENLVLDTARYYRDHPEIDLGD
ncbi:MAG: SDR family oxidoreductase [Caldilineaceae bacterium]|nr:SDR family oxidoreductase [Caldilineaceae bacterium]MCY4116955.1 SDR family oxidoreductase [Caldilineaceae bacterium]MDE0071528.1 SDR family oxidoreductase [Caldilineaceae bacterium]